MAARLMKSIYFSIWFTLLAFVLWPAQATAQTAIQVTSDNFTLSGDIDAAEAVDMISELERFRSALLEVHNLPADSPERRLDIYVVTDPVIFDILGVSEDFIAVYAPTAAGPRALINGSLPDMTVKTGLSLRRSLRHEYSHHFIYTHLPIAQPRWLSEGLAEYYAGYTELPDGQFQIGVPDETSSLILSFPISGWADMRGLFRSHQTIERRPARHIGMLPDGWARRLDTVSFFYAQSWGLVHWAMNRKGTTNIAEGHKTLGLLAERLIAMESYLTRGQDITVPPTLKSWKETNLELDEISAGLAQEVLGFPLQGPEKDAETAGTLEEIVSAYIADNPPVLSRKIRPGRLTAQVTVKNLSETEAAAIQYRQMSLTAGSRALINPTMLRLKTEIESDPDLATSLRVSEAAQQFSTGGTQAALNIIRDSQTKGATDPDLDTLALQIEYGNFLNRNYMNPAPMRDKIRPILAQYPNDPQLLGMMATTTLGDARDGKPFAAEAQSALDKMIVLDMPKRDPLKALPLVNLYIEKENYKAALELLYRAEPFMGAQRYSLQSSIEELERAIKETSEAPLP